VFLLGKKIITGADVEISLIQGITRIPVDKNTIITAVAREIAEKNNVVFSDNEVEQNYDNNITKKVEITHPSTEQTDTNFPEKRPTFIEEKYDLNIGFLESKIDELYRKISSISDEIKKSHEVIIHKDISPIPEEDLLDIKIKNGLCVIPDQGIIPCELGIKERKIKVMGQKIDAPAKETIDASGKCILPGIIDPHAHLGIFADFETEVETETMAALKGGITTIGCFFNTSGSYLKAFPHLNDTIRRKSHIDLIPHFVLTNHEQLMEIPDYVREFGVRTFKIYMSGIPGMIPHVDDAFMLDVFEYLGEVNEDCTLFIHAENPSLIERSTKKYKNQVGDSLELWALTHPGLGQREAIQRAGIFAEKTGVKTYFVHISSKESVKALRELKMIRGLKNIYAETTSPYLTLEIDEKLGIKGKMVPPIPLKKDAQALWEAINSGLIDTIGTDNTTLTLAEKQVEKDIWGAVPGYPVFGTHLPSVLHKGINGGLINLEKLVEVMCKNPAKILGVYPRKGTIIPGGDADLVIVELDKKKTVSPKLLGSRSDFSLFDGQELRGWPIMTIKGGKVIPI
jgi:dihydropyrimidinase